MTERITKKYTYIIDTALSTRTLVHTYFSAYKEIQTAFFFIAYFKTVRRSKRMVYIFTLANYRLTGLVDNVNRFFCKFCEYPCKALDKSTIAQPDREIKFITIYLPESLERLAITDNSVGNRPSKSGLHRFCRHFRET